MFRPYRQRRGPYALARPSVVPSLIKLAVLGIVAVLFLYFVGRFIIGLFGAASSLQRERVDLTVEGRGTVNYAIDGGLLQRAEGSAKLYAGDKVSTGNTGSAKLDFFDGTWIRISEQSEVSIEESGSSDTRARITVALARGEMWISTGGNTMSGDILRTVTTPGISLSFPAHTKAKVTENGVQVFEAEGDGVVASKQDSKDVTVSEGQELVLESDDADLLGARNALPPIAWNDPLVIAGLATTATETGGLVPSTQPLELTAPVDGATIRAATASVSGRYGPGVTRVRVNGYPALLDEEEKTFTQELTLEQTGKTEIVIEALDERGIVLGSASRTVTRVESIVTPPSITRPAKSGETYRTSAQEVEISGEAPAGTTGIMVNDYRLQLYKAGGKTWTYLARTELNNLKAGTNHFDVVAINQAGEQSAPVRITILVEAGEEGVVAGTTSSAAAGATTSTISETSLPTNDPLSPGTLKVTAPTAGQSHTQTGSELLIEGTTSALTNSVWVNGYRLQLYKPGVTTWNYIAKTDFGNLKAGDNTYRIVARDAQNKILDTLTYTVTISR